MKQEQVDKIVDRVSKVKIPWGNGTTIGDGFRNSELTMINHKRQQAVREAMVHAWSGYTDYAFGKDELQPISKSYNNRWGDWAISLVDCLDTLKLMEMDEEYAVAKEHVRGIDFTQVPEGYQTQMFEMVIRALGGLLGAYEMDEDPMLLTKAKQVGDILAIAFENTIHGLPSNSIDVNNKTAIFSNAVCIAEAGTIQLEFKRLSQLTGDPKYQRLAEGASDALESGYRKYPGLYPAFIFTTSKQYDNSSSYGLGAMSDSFYEYQLKQYIMNGKREQKFKDQYIVSVETVKQKLIGKSKSGLYFLGRWGSQETVYYREMEHLACFYPGLLALGAQVLDRPQDLVVAEQLAFTCYLSYKTSPTGLGPEIFGFPDSPEDQQLPEFAAERANEFDPKIQKIFDYNKYGLAPIDPRFILRPETLESLFVLYRVTGDPKYQEWGWEIFTAIEKYTKTDVAYAAYANVYDRDNSSNWVDSMESFFLAETLKYLYLLFSPSDLFSLDEYVLNTEAHPFKINKGSANSGAELEKDINKDLNNDSVDGKNEPPYNVKDPVD
ncbi:hypothetical protein J3B02_002015 [Coemansia erecta]|uniref:alpha-1,2-Mannosidase n=1 Tax=Coemansia asiatica TaxID=1052880 RepID=A0A9W7XHS3_9FUNG|nr:hypothetical protein LPJ64_005410 [Coemansia asiatica]KAJ2855727.1 hypothetical protein J3B02_002015 [Coemansia erecta]KAJ2887663.1 hypothetical protein FB639_001154 [Coemansia asiatica]